MCYKKDNIDDFGFIVSAGVVVDYAEDLEFIMEDEIPDALFEYFYGLPGGPESELDSEFTDFDMDLSLADQVNAFLDNYSSD